MPKSPKAFLVILLCIFFRLQFEALPERIRAAQTEPKQRLSIEEIKRNFKKGLVKKAISFKPGYVLIEWQTQRGSTRFDLFNLNTGERDTLPVGGFISLEEIVNEYHFIFLASGRHSVHPNWAFPFLIHCKWDDITPFDGGKYRTIRKTKYFPIDHAVEFGSFKGLIISDILVSPHMIKISFLNPFGMFAGGGGDAPHITTQYREDTSQFVLLLEETRVSPDLVIPHSEIGNPGDFISTLQVVELEKSSEISIGFQFNEDLIHEPVKYFSGHKTGVTFSDKGPHIGVVFIFSSIENPEFIIKK